MRKNHEIIKYIFSDKEISKDEKFIFFSILSIINQLLVYWIFVIQ